MTNHNLTRWRLILGRFAEDELPRTLSDDMARMDAALDFLYGREYAGRGARGGPRSAGLEGSSPNVPEWIREVRELFPRETVEVVERHALERYGMRELVTDPEVLERLEPNMALLRTILTFKGMMKGEVLETARRIVRKIIEEIRRRLESEVRRVLYGRLNRFQHSPLRIAQNFDWRRTLRANLKNYDNERRRIIAEQLHFFARIERRLPWHFIMAVDQSGSMTDSVIYSAVMAGILAGLPSLKVSLVVFDTNVVDLSGYVDDPTEALMSVQLGGGTDIASAVGYCEKLVEDPHRTIVAVVTDFYEGGDPRRLVAAVRRLREAGARVLGLAALDAEANPVYDRQMAERLADAGAEIAALTPQHLAEWLVKVIR